MWLAYPAADELGVLVVVSARPQAYLLAAEAPVYAADGTVTRAVSRFEPGPDGVIERQEATTPGTVVMGSPDTTPRTWEVLGSGQADASGEPAVPRTAVDGRAVPSGTREQVVNACSQLATSSGLTRAPRTVLWTGPLGDWSGAAVTLTAPSGARLVRVQVQAPLPAQPGTWIDESVSTVLPAGRLRDVALAWQLTGPTDSGDRPPVRHVGVLGPVGAVSARLVDGTAQLAAVSLYDRAGQLPPPGPGHEQARVEFTNAAGRVVARVPVLDLHAELPTGLP